MSACRRYTSSLPDHTVFGLYYEGQRLTLDECKSRCASSVWADCVAFSRLTAAADDSVSQRVPHSSIIRVQKCPDILANRATRSTHPECSFSHGRLTRAGGSGTPVLFWMTTLTRMRPSTSGRTCVRPHLHRRCYRLARHLQCHILHRCLPRRYLQCHRRYCRHRHLCHLAYRL